MTWLADLRTHVERATAELTSTVAGLERDRQRVATTLTKAIEDIGHKEHARAVAVDTERDARIADAFARNRYETLSVRDSRAAVKRVGMAKPWQLRRLLETFPAGWPTFVSECLRRFDDWSEGPEAKDYIALLAQAPSDAMPLRTYGKLEDVLLPGGPSLVSRKLTAQTLSAALIELRQLGFDPRWSYTAGALAAWARFVYRGGADNLWTGVRQDVALEAMLLPRRAAPNETNASWFSKSPRPPGVRGGIAANAWFLSALLRGGGDHTLLIDFLLASELGDLRRPPESRGWAKLREIDPESYRGLLEGLISDDLNVFFDHAMHDRDRKRFWLRYLSSVRRTICILDQATYARLTRELGGAEKRIAGAISRARRFTTRGGRDEPQAFCLYFDTVVVVEFSITGNAAHIYDRGKFEKSFENDIYRDRLAEPSDLKDPGRARERIVHNTNWQINTEEKLAEVGILPDPPKPRAANPRR